MTLGIDNYLDNFINNYENKEELVKTIRNIILGRNVKGLDEYSKYMLSLDMEKKLMKCMESIHLKVNNKSMWEVVKEKAPNLFLHSENLDEFIKIYIGKKDKYVNKNEKTIKDIEEYYNNFMMRAAQLEANRMYELPTGNKASRVDITKAIQKLFDKKEEKYSVIKLPNKARYAIVTAGIMTTIASTLLYGTSKVGAQNTSAIESQTDIDISSIGEENHIIVLDNEEKDEDSMHELSVPKVMDDGIPQSGISNNITPYTKINWSDNSNQKAVYDMWARNGAESDRGIATLDGRYLVAVSPIFGQTGQHIDFVLEDGTVIKCMIADVKEEGLYNEWGHLIGNGVNDKADAIDIIEWEAVVPKEELEISDWKKLKVDHVINYSMDYTQYKGVEMANGR